jgi:hypothetical protein
MKKILSIFLFFAIYFLLFAVHPLSIHAECYNPTDVPPHERCQPTCTGTWEECSTYECSLCCFCEEWAGPELDFVDEVEQGDSLAPWMVDVSTFGLLIGETMLGGVPMETEGGTGAYRREGGAIAALTNLVGHLYTVQPASSVEYLASLGNSLGLARPAYAQGAAWTAFSPILILWRTFRDISLVAFVIIFIVIGFMIMFRAKIDPQTVISVQNALPKIIITLLLITFSYAIAGFVVDLSNLGTKIIANTLKDKNLIAIPGGGGETSEEILSELLESNIFQLINPLRNWDMLTKHIQGTEIPLISEMERLPILGQLTVSMIFWFAGFFAMFKIFFALLGPYIGIILAVIFGPFQILIGALPGSTGGFTSWFKQLIVNALVFPASFAMIAIAAILKGYTKPAKIFGAGVHWGILEGMYQINWFPATIGNWGAAAGDIISFGILFTVPKVVEIIQSAFQIKPSPWGGAATEEFKAGIGRIPIVGGMIAKRM